MIGLTDKQITKIANNARDYWKENGSKGPIGPYVKRATNEYSRRLSQREYARIYRKVCRILSSRSAARRKAVAKKKAEVKAAIKVQPTTKQPIDQSQPQFQQTEFAGLIPDIPKQYH